MTSAIGLSYIIATHNHLPFLKINLEKLINEYQLLVNGTILSAHSNCLKIIDSIKYGGFKKVLIKTI